MSKNDETQKAEEESVTKSIFKKCGKNVTVIPVEGVYPDCCVEVDNKKIAIELRRYYCYMSTRKNLILRNTIKKWLEKDGNILKLLVDKIKRPLSQKQTIHYKNWEVMIKEIQEISDCIEEISIKNKYIFFKETVNGFNQTLPEIYTNKKTITLKEYLDYMKDYILDGESVDLFLKGKKGTFISVSLKYDYLNINKNEREIHDWDVWFENLDEVYKNILEAIRDKIKKYEEYYSKSVDLGEYDEYILIIYPADVPTSLSNEDILKLENNIKSNVNNFRFEKLFISICNKILILSQNNDIQIIE